MTAATGFSFATSNVQEVRSMVRTTAESLLLSTVALSGSVHADVSSRTRVVDGDTTEVGGSRIRLHGIDAPESEQRSLPMTDLN